MILNEWPSKKSIQHIQFETSIFFIKVHGLPSVFLHERMARLIGSKIETVHQNTVNRRNVVANRYLRFRVEISVSNPLSAGYFLECDDGNDIWVQFNLERVSDLCYKCGNINHVTWRCSFREPALINTPNEITTRLYKPWILTEHKGCMNFINTLELSNQQQVEVESVYETGELVQITKDKIEDMGSQTLGSCEKKERIANMAYYNVVESYQELAALELTIERQNLGITEEIKEIVVDMLRDPHFDLQYLAKWASGLIKAYEIRRNLERKSFDGLSPDFLEFTRLERLKINSPKDKFHKDSFILGPNHKRSAL